MKCLIVVDMQNDFIDGSLGSPEAKAIVPKVVDKIMRYRDNGDLIIATKDTHFNDYLDKQEGKFLPIPHCIFKTDGWQLQEDIYNLIELTEYHEGNVKVIDKFQFGLSDWYEIIEEFFWNSDFSLDETIEEFEIVGLCTDICVIANALCLKTDFPEKKITVDASCCAGSTPEKHKAALEVLKSCQCVVVNE